MVDAREERAREYRTKWQFTIDNLNAIVLNLTTAEERYKLNKAIVAIEELINVAALNYGEKI